MTLPQWLPYAVSVPLWMVVVVAIVGTLRGLRDGERPLVGLAASAAVVGWVLWPDAPGQFTDQTANYAWIHAGDEAVVEPLTAAFSPAALRVLAGALGRLGLPLAFLTALGGLMGALWMASAGLIAARMSGRRAVGVAVVVLLALDPHRLAWSRSAYHVVHPVALLALAALLAGDAAERGGRLPALAAGAIAALALGMRLDVAASLPLVALWAWRPGGRLKPLTWGVAAFGLCAALLLARPLADGVAGQAGWSAQEALGLAAFHVGDGLLLDPWWSLGLVLPLGATVALAWFGRRAGGPIPHPPRWALGIAVALAWAVVAGFIDAGPRHLLPVRTTWIGAVAWLVVGRLRRPLALAPLVLALAISALGFARYTVGGGPPGEGLVEVAPDGAAWLQARAAEGCGLVTDRSLVGVPLPAAHIVDRMDLLHPDRAEAHHRAYGGCLYWLQGWPETRWNWTASARRIEATWDWREVGRLDEGGGLRVLEWTPPVVGGRPRPRSLLGRITAR